MPVICLWESSGSRQLSEALSARACTRQTHEKQSNNVRKIEAAADGKTASQAFTLKSCVTFLSLESFRDACFKERKEIGKGEEEEIKQELQFRTDSNVQLFIAFSRLWVF